MNNNIPERRVTPPDPPDPIGECAYCGEDKYPGEEIVKIEEKTICRNDYCIKNYVKENIEVKEKIDKDYTFVDYAYDYLIEMTRMPTKEDIILANADYY